jgi:hypothetical protein
MVFAMTFAFRLRFWPLSEKAKKEREHWQSCFIGRWRIQSEIPLNGILWIHQNRKGFVGSFEVENGESAERAIALKNIQLSGKNIGFAFSAKQRDPSTPVDKLWVFFGGMLDDGKNLTGKVHERLPGSGKKEFKEFNWSASRVFENTGATG